jgi:hypothetical protein
MRFFVGAFLMAGIIACTPKVDDLKKASTDTIANIDTVTKAVDTTNKK